MDEARRLRHRAAGGGAARHLFFQHRGGCNGSTKADRRKGRVVQQGSISDTQRNAFDKPRSAKELRIVHHEKERRRTGPKFASSPLAGDSDGRGHRRGLDGPTMPKQS